MQTIAGSSKQLSQASPDAKTSAESAAVGRSLALRASASVRTRPAAAPAAGESPRLGQVRIIDIEWSSVVGVAGLQLAGRLAEVLADIDQAFERAAG